MEIAYIYTLCDPRNGIPRYVGKTFDPARRLKDHIFEHTSWKSSKKISWIKHMRKFGIKPKMEILEVLINPTQEEWDECERQWVTFLKFYGFDLKNGDSGGNTGKRLSEEQKMKISARSSLYRHSESAKRKISKASKDRMTDDERLHLSVVLTGRKIHTEEFKKKMSDLKTGVARPEHVTLAREAGREKWKEETGRRTTRFCVHCGEVIKYNFLKDGSRVPDLHFFTENLGYIHNKCKKQISLLRN